MVKFTLTPNPVSPILDPLRSEFLLSPTVALSPGGQNPLIKQVVEQFCARFASGGVVVYIGDTENKFEHLHAEYLSKLGVVIDSADKMPDVVVHDTKRNWLLLIEAVTSAGPVDGKQRKELKELFRSTGAAPQAWCL